MFESAIKSVSDLWADISAYANSIDWQALGSALGRNGLPLEVAGLVLISALAGFLIARWMYRGQVQDRSEVLRRESAIWRRRISGSRNVTEAVMRQRDRASRQLRRAARASR
jgi:hypothetical protein